MGSVILAVAICCLYAAIHQWSRTSWEPSRCQLLVHRSTRLTSQDFQREDRNTLELLAVPSQSDSPHVSLENETFQETQI